MTTRKTLIVLITSIATFCSSKSFGQKTPEELGQTTFYCFKSKNLDSLYKLIPTINEVAEFGKTLGLDSNSTEFKEFVKRYPLVIQNFKKICYDLQTDTTELNFSWTKAKLEKIEKLEKTIPIDNRKPDSKTVILTIVEIYFTSNDKKLKLTLGDANAYSAIWKPGNNITLTMQ
jgi:hypothetical protein